MYKSLILLLFLCMCGNAHAIKHLGAEVVLIYSCESSAGSGVQIGKDLFLTNAHVVRDCSDVIVNKNSRDGKKYRVLAVDKANDLALVGLSTGTVPLSINIREARDTELVTAVGYAAPDMEFTIARGSVSLKAECNIEDSASHTGITHNGMSGGPVLSAVGELVGLTYAKRINCNVPASYPKSCFISAETILDFLRRIIK